MVDRALTCCVYGSCWPASTSILSTNCAGEPSLRRPGHLPRSARLSGRVPCSAVVSCPPLAPSSPRSDSREAITALAQAGFAQSLRCYHTDAGAVISRPLSVGRCCDLTWAAPSRARRAPSSGSATCSSILVSVVIRAQVGSASFIEVRHTGKAPRSDWPDGRIGGRVAGKRRQSAERRQ
jgi:hypothetical protein